MHPWAVSCDAEAVQSTYIVQVNVDAAEVVQHKVADRVGEMDGVGIAVERLEEPRVLVGNELARLLVGPELVLLARAWWQRWWPYNVLVVRVQVNAALLGVDPNLRNGLILVCLVNDLGNYLGALFDQARIWRRKFGTVNGVGSGIFYQ